MITRSRRAALNSSSKSSSSSNLSFDSPSTSKQNNNSNKNNNHNCAGVFGNPNFTSGIELNFDHFNNNNLRRSSRRLTPTVASEKFTGLMRSQHDQQQQIPNTIEDIVKDVIGNIVNYVSKPDLKESISTIDYSTSLLKNVNNIETDPRYLSTNFLQCNENTVFSNNQPSSLSSINYSTDCNEFDEENDANRIEEITCEVSFGE